MDPFTGGGLFIPGAGRSYTVIERQPAQEVRYEASASSTLERVPQSVVQVAGDSVLAT